MAGHSVECEEMTEGAESAVGDAETFHFFDEYGVFDVASLKEF